MKLPYTDSANEALNIAEQVSKKLKHYYIGSEHILIGLLREPNGVAGTVLRGKNIEEKQIIEIINDLTVKGQGTLLKERAGLTPRTERILEDAANIATEYHSGTIGTEHILLAMLKEGTNCAVQILLALRLSIQELYVDLHVLSTPPAFILSQDQTLMLYKEIVFRFIRMNAFVLARKAFRL